MQHVVVVVLAPGTNSEGSDMQMRHCVITTSSSSLLSSLSMLLFVCFRCFSFASVYSCGLLLSLDVVVVAVAVVGCC